MIGEDSGVESQRLIGGGGEGHTVTVSWMLHTTRRSTKVEQFKEVTCLIIHQSTVDEQGCILDPTTSTVRTTAATTRAC